jgi:hypothetical protein
MDYSTAIFVVVRQLVFSGTRSKRARLGGVAILILFALTAAAKTMTLTLDNSFANVALPRMQGSIPYKHIAISTTGYGPPAIRALAMPRSKFVVTDYLQNQQAVVLRPAVAQTNAGLTRDSSCVNPNPRRRNQLVSSLAGLCSRYPTSRALAIDSPPARPSVVLPANSATAGANSNHSGTN